MISTMTAFAGRAVALCLFFATPALAKPWQGLTPGTSKKAEVVKKLGTPTKSQPEKGKEILVYSGMQAPSGSRQAQVKLDDKGVVERIDVYPAVGLSKEDVENNYGGWCNADEPTDPCYQKKNSSGNKEYWLYSELGLAVFFLDQKVEQLVFLPAKKKSQQAPQEEE
jgi:hypothetical protein